MLLIVAALEPRPSCDRCTMQARALGLDVLVEVHDREELEAALGLGAELVGINNRDLRDFSVDMERTAQLMSRIPARCDGGLGVGDRRPPSSWTGLSEAGVHAVLVGESLMRSRRSARRR